MRRAVLAYVVVSLGVAGCHGRACGSAPQALPTVQGPDGRVYRLLDRGLYKAYYSLDGKLQRIEYDNNGDGHPEQIDHHDGESRPSLTEIDDNSDGVIDRREHYDGAGRLVRVEAATHGRAMDMWVEMSPDGRPARRAYDTDGDGKPDRAEVLENGHLVRLELDTNRDGRVDRWQEWRAGTVVSEDLDTDEDGVPDRRLAYGARGQLLGLGPLPAHAAKASPPAAAAPATAAPASR